MKFNLLTTKFMGMFKTVVLVGLFLFYIYIIASYFLKFREGVDGDGTDMTATTTPVVVPAPPQAPDPATLLPTATGLDTKIISTGSTSTDVPLKTAYDNLVDSYSTPAILQQVANAVTAYKMAEQKYSEDNAAATAAAASAASPSAAAASPSAAATPSVAATAGATTL